MPTKPKKTLRLAQSEAAKAVNLAAKNKRKTKKFRVVKKKVVRKIISVPRPRLSPPRMSLGVRDLDALSVHAIDKLRAHPGYQGESSVEKALNVLQVSRITFNVPAGAEACFYADPFAPGGGYLKVQDGLTCSKISTASQVFTRDFTKMNVFDGVNNSDWDLVPWQGDRIQNTGPTSTLIVDSTDLGGGNWNTQLAVNPSFGSLATGPGATRAQHLATTSEMTVSVPWDGKAVAYSATRGEYPVLFGSARSKQMLNDGNPDDSTTQVGNLLLISESNQTSIGQMFGQYVKPVLLTGGSETATQTIVAKAGAACPGHFFEVGSTTPAPAANRVVVPNDNTQAAAKYFNAVVFDKGTGSAPNTTYEATLAPFCQHRNSNYNRSVPSERYVIQNTSALADPDFQPSTKEMREKLLQSYGWQANDSMRSATLVLFLDNTGSKDITVVIETTDKYSVMYQSNSVVGQLQAPTIAGPSPKHDEIFSASGAGRTPYGARTSAVHQAVESMRAQGLHVTDKLHQALLASQDNKPLVGTSQSVMVPNTGSHMVHDVAGPPRVRTDMDNAKDLGVGAFKAVGGFLADNPKLAIEGAKALWNGVSGFWGGSDPPAHIPLSAIYNARHGTKIPPGANMLGLTNETNAYNAYVDAANARYANDMLRTRMLRDLD